VSISDRVEAGESIAANINEYLQIGKSNQRV